MDSKASLVTAASRKMYRAVLPRLTDMISDLLSLLAAEDSHEIIMQLILDAEDAYWQVPLHASEQPFSCCVLNRLDSPPSYLTFVRTAQGSRGAPLAWSIIFGLICRCAFSVLIAHRPFPRPDTEKLQVYVDDPSLAIRGSPPHCQKQAALMILAWSILGVRLAFNKGQWGPSVNWIGANLTVLNRAVEVCILQSRLDDVRSLIDAVQARNVVSLKALRTLTGKLQSIASLMYTWRPFVHMMYAALYKYEDSGNCARGFCWRRQIQTPIDWIRAFLAENHGNLRRVFTVDSYLRRGVPISITTDASPFGIGAVLEVGGSLTSFFSDSLSVLDRALLAVASPPTSADQQVLEAFAILVALRHWSPQWRGQRVRLSVLTDNVAAPVSYTHLTLPTSDLV